MAIKKVRIPKASLPPVTMEDADPIAVLAVISTTSSSVPVYQYTLSQNHGLTAGDIVTIADIDPAIYNAEQVAIYAVPSPNTIQILGSSTSQSYVSGGTVTTSSGNYIVRYRVVSEDRNRLSHWSPQYILSPEPLGAVAGDDIFVQIANQILSVSWTIPEGATLEDFDVYVAWGTGATVPGVNEGVGTYSYQATVSGNFFSMQIPDVGYTRVSVSIQTRTYPRKYWPDIVVAKSNVVELP